nr:uncharacterized protein LOC107450524 isoform X1 [Parasteatoda tepidariorum]
MLLKLEMILIIPEAKIMEGPDTYAEVGSSINLTCVIAQKPQLMYSGTVTVQKCGRNTAVSRLKIRDAQPTNSGNYICSPTNAGAVSSIVYVVKGEKQVVVRNIEGSATQNCCGFYISNLLLYGMLLYLL